MTNNFITLVTSLMLSISCFSQNNFWFGEEESNFNVELISNGSFKTIEIETKNLSNEQINLFYNAGSILINESTSEQNLIVLFTDYTELTPFEKNHVNTIRVACLNADKKVPKKNRANWLITYDKKLGDLLEFYSSNKNLVSLWTTPELHETKDQQQAFLQMCVWIYTGAKKKTIVDFATVYMFKNNRSKAEEYVDFLYPAIATFIDLYKAF